MIVALSIVDKHKKAGQRHVGTYMFEVDHPGDTHFEFLTLAAPPPEEGALRSYLNRLLIGREIPNAHDAFGNRVDFDNTATAVTSRPTVVIGGNPGQEIL